MVEKLEESNIKRRGLLVIVPLQHSDPEDDAVVYCSSQQSPGNMCRKLSAGRRGLELRVRSEEYNRGAPATRVLSSHAKSFADSGDWTCCILLVAPRRTRISRPAAPSPGTSFLRRRLSASDAACFRPLFCTAMFALSLPSRPIQLPIVDARHVPP